VSIDFGKKLESSISSLVFSHRSIDQGGKNRQIAKAGGRSKYFARLHVQAYGLDVPLAQEHITQTKFISMECFAGHCHAVPCFDVATKHLQPRKLEAGAKSSTSSTPAAGPNKTGSILALNAYRSGSVFSLPKV